MTKLTIIYGTLTDALNRKRTGWIIVENGRFHSPLPTKDAAIQSAKSIADIRSTSESCIRVIEDKTLQDVMKNG